MATKMLRQIYDYLSGKDIRELNREKEDLLATIREIEEVVVRSPDKRTSLEVPGYPLNKYGYYAMRYLSLAGGAMGVYLSAALVKEPCDGQVCFLIYLMDGFLLSSAAFFGYLSSKIVEEEKREVDEQRKRSTKSLEEITIILDSVITQTGGKA